MSLYNIIRIDLKKGKITAEEEAEKLKIQKANAETIRIP
jgi:hypothetical protein